MLGQARTVQETQNIKSTLQALRDAMQKPSLSTRERAALTQSIDRSLSILDREVRAKTSYEVLKDAKRRSAAQRRGRNN